MEPSVNKVEVNKEFQGNSKTELPNFHNYGLQSSESIEVSTNENNSDLCKSVIFKFGDSYMCPGCQQTFLYLSNLKRHVQNKHPPLLPILFPLCSTKVPCCRKKKSRCSENSSQSSENPSQGPKNSNNLQTTYQYNEQAFASVYNSVDKSYACPECPKAIFYQIYSFKRHLKNKHPSLFLTLFPPGPSHVCNICGKNCKSTKSLQHHKSIVHNLHTGMPQHKCPLCMQMFTRIKFNEHFEKSHNLIMKPVKINFGSYEKFIEWKKAIERVTKSYFIKHNSKCVHKNGVKRQAFICHRSGTFKSEAVLNKRKLKAQGSRKINAFCPAIMRISITNEGTCQLVFYNQHIGHDNELHHLNLTPEEKKYVADILAININLPIGDILSEIHNSAAKDGAERLCLLNKKDLYNIRSTFLKDNQFYLSAPKLDEKLTKDLRDIHNKHAESEHIDADITKIEKGWVLTSSDTNEICLIKEILKSCNCTLVCIYCKVCLHTYSCTCLDSSIQGNMCKHIHFFCTERSKMHDNLDKFLDFNSDAAETSSNSAQYGYPQKNNNMLKLSEFSEKDNVTFTNSEKRSALKKKFSDILDSITTEEEFQLSESVVQDLSMKLKSIQSHSVQTDGAVISNISHPVQTELVSEKNTQDHLYSSPLIHKIAKPKQNSNCTEPASRTLILEMRNVRQGAKICCINFAKADKK